MFNKFWNDEAGVIISAELVLVLTICVLGVIVGLSSVVVAINTELQDTAHAIGSLNQSFRLPGFTGCVKTAPISYTAGASYTDAVDDCDCATSCDMITPGTAVPASNG